MNDYNSRRHLFCPQNETNTAICGAFAVPGLNPPIGKKCKECFDIAMKQDTCPLCRSRIGDGHP